MEAARNLPPPSPWRVLSESQARKVDAVSATILSHLDYTTDRRLQKAFYLAEVWSIEERLARLSDADFASWHYGPWSLHVRESGERLAARGLAERVAKPAKDGYNEVEFLKVGTTPHLEELQPDEREFLTEVSEALRYVKSAKLTDVAKTTAPFRMTAPGAHIDLDAYLETLTRRHAKLVDSPKVAALVAEAKAG